MLSPSGPHPSPQTIRKIAAKAAMHEKTVRRFFRGLPVQPTTRDRIRDALRELGLPPTRTAD